MTISRHKSWALVAALGASAIGAALVFRTPTPAPAQPPPTAAPAATAAATRAGVLGSSGCSATACHGGPIPAGGVSGASAATLWFAHDPHARAFDALRSETGQKIARLLAAGGRPKPAERDWRCLACHTNPATVLAADGELDESPPAVAVRVEGVGCESCHGAASRWVVPHSTWSVPPDRPAAYTRHGMAWINDLATRARACAGCHVGAPEDEERRVPLRDVTHDMLAAGHPPLAFEFSSYARALPRHWTEIDRARMPPKNRRGDGHSAREWLVGQLVSGESALRLFAGGAARAERDSVWPEFARLDCAGCHRPVSTGGTSPPRCAAR